MFKPGNVVSFYSNVAGKKKYHLCLSLQGCFLFINTPKKKVFSGDFVVSCTTMPFLPPTETGKSIISCSTLIRMTDAELRHLNAQCLGSISFDILRDLIRFVEESPVLSPDDKDAILDELGNSV